jgi:hypothetical protein
MSDELDPGLRRLFASTAEHPADEAFVSAVTTRTSRERLIASIASIALGMAPGFVVAMGLGAVAAALGLVLDQSAKVITPLLDASPVGLAAGLGLAIAGFVCFRLLAPLALRRA